MSDDGDQVPRKSPQEPSSSGKTFELDATLVDHSFDRRSGGSGPSASRAPGSPPTTVSRNWGDGEQLPRSPGVAPGKPRSPSRTPAGGGAAPGSTQRTGPPWKRIAWFVLAFVVLVCVSAGVAVVLVVRHFSANLPDVENLEKGYAPPQVVRVLARDGTLLANVFSERRTVVPFDKIPDHVKSAFLAAEDAGFFEHEGLNYLGLVRAMVSNVRAGRVKQGGSTITQQVVKNVLLDQERSYRRKIRETILAYRLEQALTKSQILAMYLNQIYFGHGRYGVEEAGRYYFGKHVGELDVAEAALLAGIVAAPERYSPRKDERKALVRREYVLSQMLAKGFMTRPVFDASLRSRVRLAPAVEFESDIAPEMVGHAQRLLQQVVGEGAKRGGFTVTTTIDPALQVAARAALRHGLDDYLVRQRLKPPYTLETRRLWGKVFQGTPRRHEIHVGKVTARDDKSGTIAVQLGEITGLVFLNKEERFNPTHLKPTDFVGAGAVLRVRVLDDPLDAAAGEPVHLSLDLAPQAALIALHPKTREVLAAVGSYEALAGGLDRSVQSKRQPGSTFKPIVYSYALNTHQVTAATTFQFPPAPEELADIQKRQAALAVANPHEPALLVPNSVTMSLRQGVARSDNRVARSVFRSVGGPQAVQWAQALGISSHLGADDSLMLGSYEVSVLEMASAYAVFASGGTALDPVFVMTAESGAGPVVLPPRAPERRVMEPAVAYLTTSLLESVVKEGTGKRASVLGRPLAGKTGTTNAAKDGWFVGYSTDLVVAVWVGYDDALSLGWGESGATSALPIWTEFMKTAHTGKPATQFSRPAEIEEAVVDPLTGLLARYGQEDGAAEVFLPGTVPQETAPEPGDVGADVPALGEPPPEGQATSGPDVQGAPSDSDTGDNPSRGASPPAPEEPPPF